MAVTCGDAAEVVETAEHALDGVAPGYSIRLKNGFQRWVIAGRMSGAVQAASICGRPRRLFPVSQQERERAAKVVGEGVDPDCAPAPRAADGTILLLSLAPAA